MEKPYEELKTIVCHLGNGSSVTAVMNGTICRYFYGNDSVGRSCNGNTLREISILRSWNLSQRKNILILTGVMDVLNKESGVFGISGELSSDFRDLTNAMNSGDKKAKIAMDVFSYNVAKYVGAYAAVMNGVDDIVFTAGIGENDDYVREQVCCLSGISRS